MNLDSKRCIYCNQTYEKDTEHVFPHGLGGEKVFMDCVCPICNGEFSRLERELYQKSPLALMRSVEGVKGYKKNEGKAILKAPILLIYDDENNIVYEVTQHDEMRIYLKAQIIEIKDSLYLEATYETDVRKIVKKIEKWRENGFVGIMKFPDSNDSFYNCVKFILNKECIENQRYRTKRKVRNAVIFEDFSPSHELFNSLSPRIFLDNDDNLRIRSKTIEEGIQFLNVFIKLVQEDVQFRSFNKDVNDNGIVYVGQSFNGACSERAIVKITLNCLIHYFPQSKVSDSIMRYIKFVRLGEPKIPLHIEEKSNLIDSNERSHNILIHQYNNSVRIRLSLFNGQMIITNIISELKLMSHNDYCRIVVDYEKRINRIEQKNDIFNSLIIKGNKI